MQAVCKTQQDEIDIFPPDQRIDEGIFAFLNIQYGFFHIGEPPFENVSGPSDSKKLLQCGNETGCRIGLSWIGKSKIQIGLCKLDLHDVYSAVMLNKVDPGV